MPTSTVNELTKVTAELQVDLAEYGIVRKKVMEQAAPKKNGEPNFFGYRDSDDEVELKFNASAKTIQKSGMKMGMAVPENKSFDLLLTENFQEAISTVSEDKLRSFIRSIVNQA